MSINNRVLIHALIVLSFALAACETAVPVSAKHTREFERVERNKEVTMYEAIIERIKSHDETVIAQCVTEQDTIVQSILDAFGSFDLESRMLSLNCFSQKNSPGSAQGLLKATKDEELDVSNEAVGHLRAQSHMVPPDEIIKAIQLQDVPYIREQLYLILGDSAEPLVLPELRAFVDKEEDPDAANAGLAAMVKLHSQEERSTFTTIVQDAEVDEAVVLTEKLLYIGDQRLLKAMLPWLRRQDGVFRLGSDRTPDAMVRMSDLAVWTMHQMGFQFQPPLAHIDNYSDEILSQAHYLLSAIN